MSDKARNQWMHRFAEALDTAANRQQIRTRRTTYPGESTLVDFGSNDYLGLRDRQAISSAVTRAAIEYGWGSGASSVLSGYSAMHKELEHALAEHCDSESALVFSSGYACNTGTLACLASQGDAIFSDALNHASLIDGIRLSKAQRIVFPHLDIDFLESNLRKSRASFGQVLIVTESVFSMDGDCADLRSLTELASRYDCGLVVDEAHATGIFGPAGSGLLAELEIGRSDSLILKLGTLSKAFGSIGGFAAGSQLAIDYLVNHCRSYIFSTAPPAAAVAASLASLALLREMDAERSELRRVSSQFRNELSSQGWKVPQGDSPIIPVIVGAEDDTLALSRRLAAEGFYVPAIRPPTVRPGTSRLRISLSTRHTAAQRAALASAFARV